MKFEKKVMGKLNKCYSIAGLKLNGEQDILIAAEKQDACLLFNEKGEQIDTVWEQPGGVMTMVQVPGKDGMFLATHKFYSPNDSKEAKLVIAEKTAEGWSIRTLCDLPFVHRFDILTRNGVNYLIACALKSGHEYKDDWRFAGKVFAAVLPDDLSAFNDDNQLELKVIKENMLKNHGYIRHNENGVDYGLISCEGGVFAFFPPEAPEKNWEIRTVSEIPASDAVLADFDGDGEDELALIYHFHGNEIQICKKSGGVYAPVYTTPAPFAHAIWGGELCGKMTLVIGFRNEDMDIIAISWNGSEYERTVIDHGTGSANAAHFVIDGKDTLVMTNRGIDEIAMYTVEA